jgi:hypothetical protein
MIARICKRFSKIVKVVLFLCVVLTIFLKLFFRKAPFALPFNCFFKAFPYEES